jgi:CheY-like chemotaxis protein
VLIVDDDPALTATLITILASEGLRVAGATDGADGLVRARAQRPAVILLDLQLPGLDGCGFLEALRAWPAGAAVPVILLLDSQDMAATRRRITLLQAVLLIPKPFDLDLLLAAVRGAVRWDRERGPQSGRGRAGDPRATAAARWGGGEQEAVCPAPWRETGWLDHGEERGGLQRLARCPWPDRRAPSLRWILCHLSEEYARYTGQADLLRAAVDGLTGE